MVELAVVALVVLQLDTEAERAVGDNGLDAHGTVAHDRGHVGLVVVGKERGALMNDTAAGAHGEQVAAIGQAGELLGDGTIGEVARRLPLVEVAGAHLGRQIIGVLTFEGIVLRERPAYWLLGVKVVVAGSVGVGDEIGQVDGILLGGLVNVLDHGSILSAQDGIEVIATGTLGRHVACNLVGVVPVAQIGTALVVLQRPAAIGQISRRDVGTVDPSLAVVVGTVVPGAVVVGLQAVVGIAHTGDDELLQGVTLGTRVVVGIETVEGPEGMFVGLGTKIISSSVQNEIIYE